MISVSASLAPFCQPFVSFAQGGGSFPAEAGPRKRVLVLGAGEAARRVVQGLRHAPVELVLLNQRVGGLVQELTLEQPNARVRLGPVEEIDTAARLVRLGGPEAGEVAYDVLVVAPGEPAEATPNGGAEAICARIRLAFDYAESEPDAEERRRLLTFVVVGGGPVGVELAGALASTAALIRAEEAREVVEPVRIVLAEAGGQVLPGVSEAYARGRQAALEAAGVEVRLGSAVTEMAADHVVAGGKRIEARTALWVGSARHAASDFLVARVAGGRPEVTERLCLRDDPGVFVIGPSASGEARRRGAYVARAIRLGLEGRVARPFRVSVLSRLLSAVMLAGSVRLPPTARPAAA